MRSVNAVFGRRIRWYLDPSSSPASAAPRAAHDAGAATQAAQSAGSTKMGKRGAAVRKQCLCARGRSYRAPYGAEYGECHSFGSWQHLNNMLGPGLRGSPTPCPKVAPAVLYHAPGPRTPQPRESTIFRHGCPGQATERAKFWMRPCGPASLRMGITQYSEVSAEYASLLVENVDSSVPLGSYFPCAECLYF